MTVHATFMISTARFSELAVGRSYVYSKRDTPGVCVRDTPGVCQGVCQRVCNGLIHINQSQICILQVLSYHSSLIFATVTYPGVLCQGCVRVVV